jgi:asparagine synthase (glutamine-hydrolysing)
MCGIAGYFAFDRSRTIDRNLIDRMNSAQKHRGPDDDGIFIDGSLGFGHRRLSIIDVEGGHQPLSNEDGTIWVLLNGEIYNYPKLREQLLSRGHTLVTRSDTEAIVHLYEDVGEEVFTHLNGMFAIAIWDSRNQKLVLGRDRAGEKPLFFSLDKKRIVFGSEMKALLASESIDLTVDPQALADYFSFGYVPAPKTIYKAVRKLLPGHYMVITRDSIRDKQYWDVSFANIEPRSEEQWCEEIREQLLVATRDRLMSDVPLGAFLSGGVDSSAVVAMMSRCMDRAVTTCSISFPVKEYDESQYARMIADQFKTDHHDRLCVPKALEVVDKLVWHYDEPFADSSCIPTYYVSAAAREHVTVALGGDGGDEIFAGYRRYYFDMFENRLRSLVPAGIRRSVFGPLGRLYPALASAPRVFRAKATFQSLARNPLEGYFNSISIFRPSEKPRLFSREFTEQIRGYDSINVLQQYYDRADTQDALTRIQYVDMKTYLPDDILVKVDRASMAVSLEVRAPFLDHTLMETMARMPSSLKLRSTNGKYILKKAFEPILPKDVLYRPKQGFAVPLKDWFRGELKDMAHSALFDTDDAFLDSKYVRAIWDDHQKGRFDRSSYLWSVLMYKKWQQQLTNQGAREALMTGASV